MEPFLGQIMMVGFNYAPRGWAKCEGQILPISQNQALFSLLGTTYGGDGRTTFGLPDLRGRCAIGMGQGPGLSPHPVGQMGGVEDVTLVQNQMPQHTHQLKVSDANGTVNDPTGAVMAKNQVTIDRQTTLPVNAFTKSAPNAQISPETIQMAGGSQPHTNMPPYLAMNYIIALEGIYPSRG